jgi:hypothetical protein
MVPNIPFSQPSKIEEKKEEKSVLEEYLDPIQNVFADGVDIITGITGEITELIQ